MRARPSLTKSLAAAALVACALLSAAGSGAAARSPRASAVSKGLPAPASGRSEVTLRLYGARASALSGRYVYPPITPAGRPRVR